MGEIHFFETSANDRDGPLPSLIMYVYCIIPGKPLLPGSHFEAYDIMSHITREISGLQGIHWLQEHSHRGM